VKFFDPKVHSAEYLASTPQACAPEKSQFRRGMITGFAVATRRKRSQLSLSMATRTASAVWDGTLKQGKGSMKLGSGAFEGAYSFSSRFEEGTGTNPEELIGAAEAGCYSMALAANLEKAGHPAKRISTTATVKLEMVGGGPKITSIDLKTDAEVPGIDKAKFDELAEQTKKTCPVSTALAGTQINLNATLK
jgi:osmotically inducible protein OsmC